MHQNGQTFELKSRSTDGQPRWAYRYRQAGRDSERVQRGGFASQEAAADALDRALERLRRADGSSRTLTLEELAREYLAQHQAEPETIEKLRWLLTKSVAAFGDRPIDELKAREIAAWRMTLPPGHRFEATQALRQTLARAVSWELLGNNPAKDGVDNPVPVRREQRPFESWTQLRELSIALGPRHGPMVLFASATGLRPGEWVALEHRDIDRAAGVVLVRRAFRNGRLKTTKTPNSIRAVPLQQLALDVLDERPTRAGGELLFPAARGGYLNLANFRRRDWHPAQVQARIDPGHRIYDLRHTFATFALRAGMSTFDLSRYMGASLTMIDRHYGHLARDGRQHAISMLNAHANSVDIGGRSVDTGATPASPAAGRQTA